MNTIDIAKIPEREFNDKQKRLYELMSDISEDCWFAGWMMGNEYSLWDAMQTGQLHYGTTDIDANDLNDCRVLSNELNGWIIWLGDSDDENLPLDDWGPYFISLDAWKVLFEERTKKHLSSVDSPIPPLPVKG